IWVNVKLARVCPIVVNSTKLAKLSNHHNCIYEELRSASLSPERRKGGRGNESSRMGGEAIELHLKLAESTQAYSR
ncbi:MAG: hypothetical protein RIF46_00385, partial [Cyclobacteriaceae bacterium]